MSDVVPFGPRPVPTAAVAIERLDSIWNAVQTFVCQMQPDRLTPEGMARILQTFDTANACIRVVLSDFGNDPAIHQLIGKSLEIKALIETARERIASLTAVSAAASSAPAKDAHRIPEESKLPGRSSSDGRPWINSRSPKNEHGASGSPLREEDLWLMSGGD